MFSSNSLLQLVFADEGDTYYCDSLLELDLNRYLWMELHEKYDLVYFLSPGDETVTIRDAGDIGIKSYSCIQKPTKKKKSTKKKCFGSGKKNISESKRFCGWMQERLMNKCAFVSTAADFCSIFEQEEWLNDLEESMSSVKFTGTIVLILPPYVERSHKCLLESPVFLALRDKAVNDTRRGDVQDHYGCLKKYMGESCVFLNSFTKERIRPMLCRVVFRYKERFQGNRCLDLMAEYISQYLNNRELRWCEQLFDADFDTAIPFYSDIYSQLLREKVWNRLTNIIEQVEKSGSVQQYLTQKNIAYINDSAAAVRLNYERSSFAWKCFRLRPEDIVPGETECDQEMREMLREICTELGTPENRPLDKDVSDAIDVLLLRLENARISGDSGTCWYILYAIKFCAEFLYTSANNNSSVIKIIDNLNNLVKLSEDIFTLSGVGKNAGLQNIRNKYEEKRITSEMMLERCREIVNTSVTELRIKRTQPVEIRRISENMAESLNDLMENNVDSSAEDTPEQAENNAVTDISNYDDNKNDNSNNIKNNENDGSDESDDDDFYFSSSLSNYHMPSSF